MNKSEEYKAIREAKVSKRLRALNDARARQLAEMDFIPPHQMEMVYEMCQTIFEEGFKEGCKLDCWDQPK